MPIPGAMVLVKGNWLFCADNCDDQLRCFYRVDLSFSVHTTAMVQLRWFWLREIGFSVHTTAKANCDGPTAMLLPRMRKHAQGC
jgi:hypothetical protein